MWSRPPAFAHIIENLARNYVDILKANKTKECKEPLEALYNKTNCIFIEMTLSDYF
jgi:hypothetical protein